VFVEGRSLSLEHFVFLSSGFGGARMQAIADAAGVDKAMLYRYFDSKDQLFHEAIAAPLAAAVQRAAETSLIPHDADDEAGNLRQRSTDFIRDLLGAMREIAPPLGVVLSDEAAGSRFYKEHLQPRIDQMPDVIAANAPMFYGSYDPEIVVRAVYGMCYFFALDERFGRGSGQDIDELAPALLSIFFDGLAFRDQAKNTLPPRGAAGPLAAEASHTPAAQKSKRNSCET
jgi:AcrR family transcriptional regulator